MVTTHKNKQSNRRLLSQLHDFGHDVIFGNTVSDMQEKGTVNEGIGDPDFTVGTADTKILTNENTVTMKTLERCFLKTELERSNNIGTFEDRIQTAIFIANDSIFAPKNRVSD